MTPDADLPDLAPLAHLPALIIHAGAAQLFVNERFEQINATLEAHRKHLNVLTEQSFLWHLEQCFQAHANPASLIFHFEYTGSRRDDICLTLGHEDGPGMTEDTSHWHPPLESPLDEKIQGMLYGLNMMGSHAAEHRVFLDALCQEPITRVRLREVMTTCFGPDFLARASQCAMENDLPSTIAAPKPRRL